MRLFFIIAFFIGSSSLGLSQESDQRSTYQNSPIQEQAFSKDDWQAAIEGIDYSRAFVNNDKGVDEDEGEGIGRAYSNSERDYLLQDEDAAEKARQASWVNFYKILFILLVITLVVFLAYRLLGKSLVLKPNRKIPKVVSRGTIEQIEEEIHESDLDLYIQQALAQGDYTLAIRLYYLAVIKELSLSELIRWKREKTNRDYYRELKATPLSGAFREATRIFERVWYGNHQLPKQDFNALKPKFLALIKAARNNKAVAANS
ncbi:MAG: DUF4129 domain-containing protein [Bacteroidota bacterium]